MKHKDLRWIAITRTTTAKFIVFHAYDKKVKRKHKSLNHAYKHTL